MLRQLKGIGKLNSLHYFLLSHKIQIPFILFLFFFLFFPSILCVGQTNTPLQSGYPIDFNKINPPSPTTAELGKYGSFPVNYYTGVPNISIPIYELEAGSLKLPISLSYHASGIRVDDIASWVGLGWSLNAGGVISITQIGKPDFPYCPPSEDCPTRLTPMTYLDIIDNNVTFTGEQLETMSLVNGNNFDTESDLYSYNFSGYSGSFLIDHNDEVKLVSNSGGLQITVDRILKKITIRDIHGNWYYFSEHEITSNTTISYGLSTSDLTNFVLLPYGGLNTTESITSFLLTEIVSYDGQEHITFEYDPVTYSYLSRINGFIETKNSSACSSGTPCDIADCQSIEYTNEYNTNYHNEWELQPTSANFSRGIINISGKTLRHIHYDRGNIDIEFISQNRDDIVSSKRLSEIILNLNGDRINKWLLINNTYFHSNIAKFEDVVYSHYSHNPLHLRLRLSGIQELGKLGNNSLKSYSFDYYGDDDPNLNLPYRNSYSGFDYWGFCNNGNPTNSDVSNAIKQFPSNIVSIFESNPSLPGSNAPGHNSVNNSNSIPLVIGGNLEPNETYINANMLKRITYPTKGSTEFIYELNSFSQVLNSTYGYTLGGGLRIKKIIDISNSSPEIIKEYTYQGGCAFNIPAYLTQGFVRDGNFGYGYYKNNCYKLFNNPINSLSSYGNLIGYKLVTEKISNSKSVYMYYTPNDDSGGEIINYFSRIDFGDPNGDCGSYFNMRVGSNFANTNIFPRNRQFDQGEYGKSYKWGLAKSITTYNSDNDIIKNEEMAYDYLEGDKVYGNKVYLKKATCGIHCEWWPVSYYFILFSYHHQTGKSFLKTKTTTLYDEDGNNPITTTEEYNYNAEYELIKSKEEQLGSRTIKTTYTYPFDYPDETYEEAMGNRTPFLDALHYMTFKRMLAYPVETLISENGSWKDGNLNLYKRDDNRIRPITSYNYKIGVPQMGTQAFNGRVENPTYFYRTINYDLFDLNNNILQYHKEDNIYNSYIWSYNNTYLISETKNATINETGHTGFENQELNGWSGNLPPIAQNIENVRTGKSSILVESSTGPFQEFSVGTNARNHSGYKASVWVKGHKSAYLHIEVNGEWSSHVRVSNESGDDNQWHLLEVELPRAKIEPYFNQEANLKLKVYIGTDVGQAYFDDLRFYPMDAQMTTYTYDLLIGVTSASDANNKATTYEYDGLGRLVVVRDYLGNILKMNDYHYKQ